jgi:hypothetical protein
MRSLSLSLPVLTSPAEKVRPQPIRSRPSAQTRLALDDILCPSRKTLALARKVLRSYGANYLLGGDNPKTVKGEKLGYATAVLYLAPGNLSGFEVCPRRSPGCTDACLHTAGNPVYFRGKERARIARTRFAFEEFDLFRALLVGELCAYILKAKQVDLIPVVRLNGTSDLLWEKLFPSLFSRFPLTQFYDYTKIGSRMATGSRPTNYDLTFSRSETNHAECHQVLASGGRVAIVIGNAGISAHPRPFAASFEGYPTIDADKHDLRFLEPPSSWAVLRAKGRARKDASGFVVSI